MIESKQVASEVSERILEINRLLNEAVVMVNAKCSAVELSEFRLAAGKVMGELLLEIANPLYRQHPDLKPEDLFIP